MTPSDASVVDKAKRARAGSPAWLFFQRWLANPLAMGSITPSSAALRKIVRDNIVCGPDQVVAEFGGGTGAITKAMLEAGIPGDRIFSFEIDRELAGYLEGFYPDINVIHGDCRKVAAILGPERVGKVGTVIIGIPMITLPMALQREIVDATFSVMPEGSRFLLYTYMIHSPLNQKALGLKGRRVGFTPFNIPPASVWAYWKA
ncbi:class I SAM-dependent methyltransferase [Azospirillum sp. A39]|uniref:class I SAM-dependent methyltransferase n=1 Tax=Azospirillum sp. A39 TaxID=3462279 RepID=UPI0040465DA1